MLGASGEALVASRLLSHGYTVLLPSVPEPYDMVASKDGEYHLVQVKSTSYNSGKRFEFVVKRHDCAYKNGDTDFIILVALPIQTCWVIPFLHLNNSTKVNINPDRKNRWTQYCEAWNLI
tara:strand:- start:8427 stop:8786 length:360 start_codon:yes stop_codon:yes gene_type:complete